MTCYLCQDKGLSRGCPNCGKTIEMKSQITKPEVLTKVLSINAIPAYYKDNTWDSSILIDTHPNVSKDLINLYCKQLDSLYNIFKKGHLPRESAFILAPRGFGKRTLAYSCMTLALRNGFTTCPILDNTEIKRINILSGDRPEKNNFLSLPTLEELLTADVLFCTTDYDNFKVALRTFESIIDKRSRYGKVTFILSRYNLNDMSFFEGNNYRSLQNFTKFNNTLKYPIQISIGMKPDIKEQ